MVADYMAELRTVMPGYDPARSAPPEPGDFRWPDGTLVIVVDGSQAAGCGALRRLSDGQAAVRAAPARGPARFQPRPGERSAWAQKAVAAPDTTRAESSNDMHVESSTRWNKLMSFQSRPWMRRRYCPRMRSVSC